MNCPRCAGSEVEESHHAVCGECYSYLVDWHGSSENTVGFWYAWGKFLQAYYNLDFDGLKDFVECKGLWNFLDDVMPQTDLDSRQLWFRQQIEKMK